MSNKLLLIAAEDTDAGELARYFIHQDWQVQRATSLERARQLLIDEEFGPHVIVADAQVSDLSVAQLEALHAQISFSEWVFAIPPNARIEHERLDQLAYYMVEKPLNLHRLEVILKRALRASLTARRLANYSITESKRYHIDAYIGSSKPVEELKEMLRRLTDVPISTITITGETGTGKGLTARIIHNTGLRKDGPLVELNCAAIPKELMESQLFGHEIGAFTGAQGRHRGLLEQADGGTLFLDEVGDMDLDLQAKLLKAIEDKRLRRLGSEKEISIDAQIIAATGIDLDQAVIEGRFRDDLYHRLSVFRVNLPPLRERIGDLVELVPRMIAEYNSKASRHIEFVPDQVWEKLLAYDWPGNIRELRNVVERCVLLSADDTFPARWLQLPETDQPAQQENTGAANMAELVVPLDGSLSLDDMDSLIIQRALELNGFNMAKTARLLGTTRETLRYRVQKYDLKTSA